MENGFVYILTLLFTIAFSSFVTYDSEKARSSRMALGVILLASLTSFLVNTLAELKNISYSDFPEYQITFEESFTEQTVSDAFVRGIEAELIRKFNFSEDEIEVSCMKFDLKTVSAEKINVRLSGTAAFADIRAVRDYVENARLGDCEVIVLFE